MVPILMMMNRLISRRQKSPKNKPTAEVCRTCLSTDQLCDIFFNSVSVIKRSRELKQTTGLEINYRDGLSQKICKTCNELIQMALKFRRTCRRAQKTLQSVGKSVKIETNVSKVEITNDFNYDYYGDDFQNGNELDNDFDVQQKPIKEKAVLKKKVVSKPTVGSYKCHICPKEFRMKATYRAHVRFHTNYCVCESCGKRCRNNNQLQEHKRARHGLGKIHKCAYCEYSSATKEALTIHERRHTGERPYNCDHCGASFIRRATLVQHIAIHLPEKNFQCDMCPKRLKSKKFLQIHKHNAHTGKRYGYLCPVCEHRFDKPNKVRAHMRRVHGIPDEQHGPIIRVQL